MSSVFCEICSPKICSDFSHAFCVNPRATLDNILYSVLSLSMHRMICNDTCYFIMHFMQPFISMQTSMFKCTMLFYSH